MMGYVMPSKLAPEGQRLCPSSPSCCAFGPNSPQMLGINFSGSSRGRQHWSGFCVVTGALLVASE